MNTAVTALVPMRHHSKRVAGKNYRAFSGRPLYHWIVETLRGCASNLDILIDTDSPFIMEDAAKHFPDVRVIERPAHLRDGNVPMNEVLLHDVQYCDSEIFLQTHSTNPLLRGETVDRAIRLFQEHYPEHDSVFSVTALRTRLWDAQARPINHDPAVLLRTQDLPPVYQENSCLYIFHRSVLETQRNRIGKRPRLFEIEAVEAMDIDEEMDFQVAEFLHKAYGARR